ncbi:hypothetical protein Tco_0266718 [Tanacetum coccineum]
MVVWLENSSLNRSAFPCKVSHLVAVETLHLGLSYIAMSIHDCDLSTSFLEKKNLLVLYAQQCLTATSNPSFYMRSSGFFVDFISTKILVCIAATISLESFVVTGALEGRGIAGLAGMDLEEDSP